MKRLIQSGGSGRRIDEVRRKVKIEFRRAQTPNQIFVRKVQTTSLSALDFLRVLARAYAYYYANFSIFTFTLHTQTDAIPLSLHEKYGEHLA